MPHSPTIQEVEELLNRRLMLLGIDIQNPMESQSDMQHMRAFRVLFYRMLTAVVAVCTASTIFAGLYLFMPLS